MKAYVVCLSNDRYLPGLYAIALGLRKTGAAYPLVVLVPEPEKQLADWLVEKGYTVRTAPAVKVEGLSQDFYWNHTFFKLAAASMTEYEKIVLLDSDMLILENLDCLFEQPPFAAVLDAGQNWEHASLNSGVLVLIPSQQLFSDLLDLASPIASKRANEGKLVGDQDVFQAYIPDWRKHPEQHLDSKYNVLYFSYPEFSRNHPCSHAAVIHYTGAKKPFHWSTIHLLAFLFLRYLRQFRVSEAKYLWTYYWICKRGRRKQNPCK